MFSRYEIRNLNLAKISLNDDIYTNYQELCYLCDYINQKTGVAIHSDFGARNCKYDTIELKNENRFEFLTGSNNKIAFATVYVKTVINTEETDYRRILETVIDKKAYRIYYSEHSNNLIVFINKGIKWTDSGVYEHMLFIKAYIYALLNNEQRAILDNDEDFNKFINLFCGSQKDAIADWLKEHYPHVVKMENMQEKIKQFFMIGNKAEISRTEDTITQQVRDLGMYMEYYNNTYKKLNEARSRLEILKNAASDNHELLEAFQNIPNVKLYDINIEDEQMIFTVETNLTQYDPEKAIALTDSEYAYANWRTAGSSRFSADDRKKIIRTLFAEDPRYVLRVKQKFTLSPTNDIQAVRGGEGEECSIKNPHLDHFNCFGANGQYINQAFHEHDYTQAFILLTACVANINLMEDMTTKWLWADLFGDKSKDKCILDTESGELISIEDLKSIIIEAEMPKEVKEVVQDQETWNHHEDDYVGFEELTAGTMEDTRARVEELRRQRAAAEEEAAALGVRLAPAEVPTEEEAVEETGNNLPEEVNEALDLIEEEPEEEFVPTFNQAGRNEARINR